MEWGVQYGRAATDQSDVAAAPVRILPAGAGLAVLAVIPFNYQRLPLPSSK